MSDESRQLLRASIAAAVCGVIAGVVIYAIAQMMYHPRGTGRLVMICAGVTGFLIPRVTERVTGVCGPIMWVPALAGGLAASLVIQLAVAVLGGSFAPPLMVAGTIAYVAMAGFSIVMESV